MLIGSDCELNLALGYDDFPRKALAQTMLKQEEIFRNQVFELHRLYQTQKMLMKEQEVRVSHGENSRPFVTPFLKHLKCEYIAAEMKLGEVHTDLKLSLRADSHTFQKQSSKENNICSQSQQAVCLRESPFGKLINQPKEGFAIHVVGRREKCGAFEGVLGSSSLTNGGQKLQEEKCFDQGVSICTSLNEKPKWAGNKQHHGGIGCKNSSVKRKLFASDDVGQLDLNKAIPDESFDHSIYHWMPNSSKVSSIDTSHDDCSKSSENTFLNNSLNKPAMLDEKEMANSTLRTSPNKSMSEQICGSTLTSICGSPSESKDFVGCSGDLKPKNVGCGMSFSDKTCEKISVSGIHDKKNKEDKLHSNNSSQELLEATDSNKSPVSCKSWITDDVSSSTKTGQCGIDMSNSAHSLVKKNVVLSVGMKAQSPDQKKEDMTVVDIMVKKGAMSLIYFSMEFSGSGHDQVPVSKGANKSCEKEMPQSSSESFESLVLKQQECSPDEYCVSSTAYEATSWYEKDYGIKVRRGRRMKDFRKEILPCLASLSRQEINEDVRIMELAIQSREYRKHKSKNNNKIGCFASMRSRKSRFSHVGRKY